MAERILKSPGVTTRELDLSAPGRVTPQGIPAGVIGTAEKGPAFVPVTFATPNDFLNLFGATEGKHFGAMAVNEWLANARSCTYVRTLGVGNAAEKNGKDVTPYSGFMVGYNMRDKDRTAASKALSVSDGKYAAVETDGSADKLVKNPYAGAGTPSFMEVGALTGRAQVAAAPETNIRITPIAPGGSTYSASEEALLHGHYIRVQNQQDNELYIFWVSFQTVDAQNINKQDRKIFDGQLEVADFTSDLSHTDKLVIVDATGATNQAQLSAAVATEITGVAGLTSAPAGNSIDIDQAAPGAGTFTRVTGANAVTTAETYSHLHVFNSTQLVLETGTATTGATADAGQASSQVVTFGSQMPTDDSEIVLTGQAGSSRSVGFKAGGGTSSQSEIDTTAHNTVLKVVAELMDIFDGGTRTEGDMATDESNVNISNHLTNMKMSWNATNKTLTFEQQNVATAAFPASITTTENNAVAPSGRMYFLGARMFQNGDINYFGTNSTTDNAANINNPVILRGVLMFPSGVIPGLQENNGGNFATDVPSSTAYGTFASGKDGGEVKGLIKATTDEFRILLNGFANTTNYDSTLQASFDPKSPMYLGNVLNTDPTKIQERGHYLHAHFPINDTFASVNSNNSHNNGQNAFLLPGRHGSAGYVDSTTAGELYTDGSLYNTTNNGAGLTTYQPTYEDWRQKFSHAFTPWIKSQTLGSSKKKLFRFHMLDAGTAGHDQVKISIANIAKSSDLSSDFGSFDVYIRSAKDTDMDPVILQRFSGVNLNPSSDRYIGRVIGDENTFFDFEKPAGKQKLVTEGLYPNRSQYVRVEIHPDVENGSIDATALPIGFAGKHHLVLDGDALAQDGSSDVDMFELPLPMRENVSVGSGTKKIVDSRFYWGTQYQELVSVNEQNKSVKVSEVVSNLTKWYPSVHVPMWVGDNANVVSSNANESLDADAYNSNEFSLEKVLVRTILDSGAANTSNAVDPTMWHEAVYIRDGNSNFYAGDGAVYESVVNGPNNDKHKDAANGYRYLDVSLDMASKASRKFYKFTVPMQGGWDGLDIFDPDKSDMNDISSFREMDSATSATYGGPQGPTTAAFRKSLDIMAEKSDVDIQLLATPGLRSSGVTDYAIDKTEERFDALYIMDMVAYDHSNDRVTTSTQETSVTNTVSKFGSRNLDSSFAATYFPDVVVQDGSTNVVAPPSVAVLGAMSLNDAVAHPWFAPAGFARGALANTLETQVKLNRTNMDSLYDADINPITSLPQSGDSVVIFGQKTLLQAQSALDRVNVRRLLIDIRRKVREVANQVLFEPNRESTLARFSALVNPILGRIQAQQGVDRYKVVIDTTTTTQQDVENNTIRGKIFLQPTRSIEFISLDFVVTNQGAEI